MKTRIVLFVALTLVAQRILGAPGFPVWLSEINLVAVWIVALSLWTTQRGWPYEALALGILWDLALSQPVIGPGGIAWSATALGLATLAGLVADRSPKAWAGFGALAAPAIILIHWLCLLPLGLELSLTAAHLLRSALLTGVWCGMVGFVLAIDLPKHLRNMRLRKLR